MNAQEAIDYIHSMTWNRRATGYEHAKILLEKMGNPEKTLKYVHIGGTNGKGSTAAMTASVLQQAGYRTGLYTSPYIHRFHERMQINGEQICDKDLAEVTEYVKSFADTLEECPSEFALVCCIAFEYFARQKCDIVVLEVGMGGESDSTNVIECPEVAILTNIGLDHTEYLGNTIEEIARTKAGILKGNSSAVIYRNILSVETLLEKICMERNIRCIFPDFDSITPTDKSLDGQTFDFGRRKDIFIPLLGRHQMKNAAVVISAIDILKEQGWKISEEDLREGLRHVRWPDRFEIVSKEPLFIIDGGHNPQCVEALVENIRDYLSEYRVIVLTGVLEDKDYTEMYEQMIPYIDEFVCITPPSPRKMESVKLAKCLADMGAKAIACTTIREGVDLSLELAKTGGAVLCFGSLYSISEIQKSFENRQ